MLTFNATPSLLAACVNHDALGLFEFQQLQFLLATLSCNWVSKF